MNLINKKIALLTWKGARAILLDAIAATQCPMESFHGKSRPAIDDLELISKANRSKAMQNGG